MEVEHSTMIWRILLAALLTMSVARAAELHGIAMPDVRVIDGVPMHLNGMGLRTYSVLGIRIYVAGLYLERRSNDPTAILHSHEMKLLDIRFLRDVDAARARQAWQDSLEQNCTAPCHLDSRDLQRFLAAVPSVHEGDSSTLLFTPHGVHITLNRATLGDIAEPAFAQLMLSTFIGREPPTPQLKRELLGLRD
jgi:Chalcone isomerase-like